jgi:hypothetical protein
MATGGTCGLFGCATGGAGTGGDAADAGGQCANETCFDIFDCFLYHPNAATCGFTKCDALICKP